MNHGLLRFSLSDERDKALNDFILARPKAITCPAHNLSRPINADLTSIRGDKWVAGYDPCPECVSATEREAKRVAVIEMGVPPILAEADFSQLRYEFESDGANARKAEAWANNPVGFLILLGGVGVGKSHIAAAVIRKCRGLFISQAELLRRVREAYRNHDAPDCVERCRKASLLVLDEIGVSGGGRDEYPAIHSILSHRYEAMAPTVLTSNLSPEDFRQALGERLMDRIREAMAETGCLIFQGASHREASNHSYIERARAHRRAQRSNGGKV